MNESNDQMGVATRDSLREVEEFLDPVAAKKAPSRRRAAVAVSRRKWNWMETSVAIVAVLWWIGVQILTYVPPSVSYYTKHNATWTPIPMPTISVPTISVPTSASRTGPIGFGFNGPPNTQNNGYDAGNVVQNNAIYYWEDAARPTHARSRHVKKK